MIATRDMRELASFSATRGPVLSLYLDTDLTKQLKDPIKLVLRDLLAKARSEGASEEDIERVTRFVDYEYDWQSRGLALFSCAADGFWHVEPLPVPIGRSQVIVSDEAYLTPLSHLRDQYGPYTVVLVDQEGARLFHIDMGSVLREEQIQGEPIKHQKQGGFSATGWQRHTEQLANRNFRAAAEATARFCEPADLPPRLILGGTEENIARFRDFLPTSLQQAVVGAMPMGMNAPIPEIIDRSHEILAESERKRQNELVQILINKSKSPGAGMGVVGLAETLLALQEGRVMIMLVAEGFTAPGYICPSCDYLSVDETEHCLFCGTAQALRAPDIVERAIHKAILQDAKVEIISGNPALIQQGSIGALLRF